MGDIHTLVASLHAYSRGDAMLKELRAELRQPVPAVRRRIKGVALDTLPAGGGLNAWVAATKITASVTLTGRRVVVRLRGGRRSSGAQSDIRAIDRGRVRAPSWGRRARGDWHSQTVTPGFFTKTAAEAPEWGPAIDRAATKALDGIHA